MFKYFTVSRTYLRSFTPNEQTGWSALISSKQRAAACGRKIGGYVAATVYKLGRLILARLHAGHLTELPACAHSSLLREHHDHGSNSITHPKHSTSLSFPTGGYAACVYSNNSSLFFPTLHSIPLFKIRSVLCWLTV